MRMEDKNKILVDLLFNRIWCRLVAFYCIFKFHIQENIWFLGLFNLFSIFIFLNCHIEPNFTFQNLFTICYLCEVIFCFTVVLPIGQSAMHKVFEFPVYAILENTHFFLEDWFALSQQSVGIHRIEHLDQERIINNQTHIGGIKVELEIPSKMTVLDLKLVDYGFMIIAFAKDWLDKECTGSHHIFSHVGEILEKVLDQR